MRDRMPSRRRPAAITRASPRAPPKTPLRPIQARRAARVKFHRRLVPPVPARDEPASRGDEECGARAARAQRDDHRASTHHDAERATHRATGDQRRDRGWVTRVLSRDVRVHHAQGSHGRGGRRTRSTRGERGAMRRDGMTRVLGGASSRGTTCARPAGVGGGTRAGGADAAREGAARARGVCFM